MELRSDHWVSQDGAAGMIHKLGFLQCGIDPAQIRGRPLIGIFAIYSDLSPCNTTIPELAKIVADGVEDAGGVPVIVPIPAVAEQFIRPSSLIFRDLLSMVVEELIAANPIDGVITLSSCDKTTAAALLAVASADLPAVCITSGPMRSHVSTSISTVQSGTDIWRLREHEDVTGGAPSRLVSDDPVLTALREMVVGPGHCNTMGTASTLALITETLGLSLPGASTQVADDKEWQTTARAAGSGAVRAVREGLRPSRMITESALANAFKVVGAVAGSTNAVLHLLALAGRRGYEMSLLDVAPLLSETPVVTNVAPSGRYTYGDLRRVGGVPTILRAVAEVLDLTAETVTGATIGEIVAGAMEPDGEIVRSRNNPFQSTPGISVLKGNLAPTGALIKTAAISTRLRRHQGPAIVFDSLEDYLDTYARPDFNVTSDSVLIVRNCGPVGYPGMPEIGNLPVPPKLLRDGINDIIRISDGRMSGTSYGTVVLHVSPESAIGGPLSRVRTGDVVLLDVDGGVLEVDDADFDARTPSHRPSRQLGGYLGMYSQHVNQADVGCNLDFLSGVRDRQFIPSRSST